MCRLLGYCSRDAASVAELLGTESFRAFTSDVNTHPFRYGDYTFAHNGAIYPQERLGEILPPEWERRLAGSTDSERYLLHLMWRLAARDGDMVAAIADTTAAISERYTASSLNAILLTPGALYAISLYNRSMVPADLLRPTGAR